MTKLKSGQWEDSVGVFVVKGETLPAKKQKMAVKVVLMIMVAMRR